MPEVDGGPGASVPSSVALWSMDLRHATAPALVEIRRWASRALSHVGDEHLGDVLLVATELVTNAYDHGRGPAEVRMSCTERPCRVRIEVDDHCPEHPAIADPAVDTPGGRGMQIVAKLAASWGVRDHPGGGGKTVWAEVSCDRTGGTPCA